MKYPNGCKRECHVLDVVLDRNILESRCRELESEKERAEKTADCWATRCRKAEAEVARLRAVAEAGSKIPKMYGCECQDCKVGEMSRAALAAVKVKP